MKKFSSGFTLVELIIVIVIIGVLGSIGLMSYSTYTISARDATRSANLTRLKDSLELYGTRNSLPFPDSYVGVRVNGNTIAYQGYAGSTVLEAIDYRIGGEDPQDEVYYTYYLTRDRTGFQLMGFFEDQNNLISGVIPQANAVSYTSRFPKVEGKNLGVLTNTSYTPIQEISTIVTATYLDIGLTATTYIAHITDTTKIQGVAATLKTSAYNYSCRRMLRSGMSKGTGLYKINPQANDVEAQVYCDMETDGGGWTGIVTFNPRVNNSYYRNTNPGTLANDYSGSNGFYNHIVLANTTSGITPLEVYVSRGAIGWDGGEYYFELVGTDIYSRQGTLSDLIIGTSKTSLFTSPTTPGLTNWLNAYAASEALSTPSGVMTNFASTDVTTTYYNFPFNDGTGPTSGNPSPNDTYFSDTAWGGSLYNEDVQVYMFIREV